MELLKAVEISNFMCFRTSQIFNLSQGTYLFGANNAGKSVVLLAIRCFFDERLFSDSNFLNRTEFTSKGAGYNKCKIAIEFNIDAIETKSRKQRLLKKYGKTLKIIKTFTFREITKSVIVDYEIAGKKISFEKIDEDIKSVLKSVSITYLHPQEGTDLLKKAQLKLRERLLLNWGRRGGVTYSLKRLGSAWDDLRKNASSYLSRSLTTILQEVWPGSQTKINLPKNISEIIAISDISFQGNLKLPEIQLTSQGTGAQSMVLYLAHYLLDSDRSMHRGEYHPIWLLEEPESFLHADLIFKLGKQLNSKIWLDNIQMTISTHSPIVLASSRLGQGRIQWILLHQQEVIKDEKIENWSSEEVADIGSKMGDSNFDVYFAAASTYDDLIFIEDKKKVTEKAFVDCGIKITKSLGGVGEVDKYIKALLDMKSAFHQNIYFIIDADQGASSLNHFMKNKPQKIKGIKKYPISERIFMVLLPKGKAVEDLFSEYDNFLDECVGMLFKQDGIWQLADNVPARLSRTCDAIRKQGLPANINGAKMLIRNTQDVKDSFWKKVSDEKLTIAKKYIIALKETVGIS